MYKSKNIYLSIFALIVAFIGVFGFCIQKDNIINVNADSVSSNYEFNGSGFIVYASQYQGVDVSNVGYLTKPYYFKISNLNADSVTFIFEEPAGSVGFVYSSTISYVRDSWVTSMVEAFYDPLLNTHTSFAVQYNIPTNWVADVNSLTISSSRWGGTNTEIGLTFFNLTDINGVTATFGVFVTADMSESNSYYYDSRTYFLTSNISNNDYYSTGYNNGYSVGRNEGLSEGTSQGYNQGYNAGKNVGFDEGVASANDYSFLGLLGSVVDAPLNMFVQTFDFNVLGFNMKDFFLSILTIALIFTIIRLCMGGKS